VQKGQTATVTTSALEPKVHDYDPAVCVDYMADPGRCPICSFCDINLATEGKALDERKKLSKEEARIIDLLARGLSRDFPNPQRAGCPDSEVLRGIAFRELRLTEVQQWLDHLGSCSPCYQEFTVLRKEAVSQQRST
jgi:hypothetical protein